MLNESFPNSVPLDGLKMTFPTSKNFAIRNYEFFDKLKLASYNHHKALQIMNQHLIKVNQFKIIKENELNNWREELCNSINHDLDIFQSICNDLLLIKELELKEKREYEIKIEKIELIAKENESMIDKKSSDLQIADEIKKYELIVKKIHHALQIFIEENETNFKGKLLNSLLSEKDNMKSKILIMAAQILYNKEIIGPSLISSLFSNFRIFLDKIQAFVEDFNEYQPNFDILGSRKLLDEITVKMDPVKSNKSEFSQQYFSLFPICKWSLAAIDFILNKNYLRSLKNNFNKALEQMKIYNHKINSLNQISNQMKNSMYGINENLIEKLLLTINEVKEYENKVIINQKIEMMKEHTEKNRGKILNFTEEIIEIQNLYQKYLDQQNLMYKSGSMESVQKFNNCSICYKSPFAKGNLCIK